MILAVAERANIKGVPAAGREAFRAEWSARWRHPGRRVRYMLGLNSMVAGCQSRRRMTRLLGLPADVKTINLLWPDCVPGTWDAAEAHVSMLALMSHIADVGEYDRLVLLGRRVAEAFHIPATAEWGDRFTIGDGDAGWRRDAMGQVIVLPHPSGRSTILNDPRAGDAIRARVALFLEGKPDDRLSLAPARPAGDGGQDPGPGPGAGLWGGVDARPA